MSTPSSRCCRTDAEPRLKKNTPRSPPTTPIGVSAASMIGKRSSALPKKRLVAEERQVVVAAHLGVAAEIEVARELAPALVGAGAQREHAVGAEAQVIAGVGVHGLAREQVAKARRVLVAERTSCGRRAGRIRGTPSSRARRLMPSGSELAVREEDAAVVLLLVLVGGVLQPGVVVFLAELQEAARQLEPGVAVDRVDGAERAAARRLRGQRGVAVDVAVDGTVELPGRSRNRTASASRPAPRTAAAATG